MDQNVNEGGEGPSVPVPEPISEFMWEDWMILTPSSFVEQTVLDEARLGWNLSEDGVEGQVEFLVCSERERITGDPRGSENDLCFFMYEDIVRSGLLTLPFSDFECEVMQGLRVAPAQLHPTSWGFVKSFEALCKHYNARASLSLFSKFFTVSQSGKDTSCGIVSLTARRERSIFQMQRSFENRDQSKFFKIRPHVSQKGKFLDREGKPRFPLKFVLGPTELSEQQDARFGRLVPHLRSVLGIHCGSVIANLGDAERLRKIFAGEDMGPPPRISVEDLARERKGKRKVSEVQGRPSRSRRTEESRSAPEGMPIARGISFREVVGPNTGGSNIGVVDILSGRDEPVDERVFEGINPGSLMMGQRPTFRPMEEVLGTSALAGQGLVGGEPLISPPNLNPEAANFLPYDMGVPFQSVYDERVDMAWLARECLRMERDTDLYKETSPVGLTKHLLAQSVRMASGLSYILDHWPSELEKAKRVQEARDEASSSRENMLQALSGQEAARKKASELQEELEVERAKLESLRTTHQGCAAALQNALDARAKAEEDIQGMRVKLEDKDRELELLRKRVEELEDASPSLSSHELPADVQERMEALEESIFANYELGFERAVEQIKVLAPDLDVSILGHKKKVEGGAIVDDPIFAADEDESEAEGGGGDGEDV